MQASRLTGQSLLRAEWNSNECNWSTARKKIGPVNRPCDRPIDVISIASLMFLVTSRLADQRTKAHYASQGYYKEHDVNSALDSYAASIRSVALETHTDLVDVYAAWIHIPG